METFDFAIIGAGPSGEAAAYEARELGATVAIIDREWFGGSCPHIGCLPSKSLLDGAARHHANAATYDWDAASTARDLGKVLWTRRNAAGGTDAMLVQIDPARVLAQ